MVNSFIVSAALSLTAYCLTLAVYRLFFSPLAKFPGPKLAALTRWYETYYDVLQDGQYTFKIAELHKKYGSILRISPFEIHISDASFYEKLYREDGRWDKYPWSVDAFGVPHATICTPSHDLHRARRAPLNPYFSKAAISTRQDMIQTRLERLCDRIDKLVETKSVFNIGTAFSALTIDVATEFILGESYDNLERKDFDQCMTNMLQASGGIWRTTKHFPFIDSMVKAMPLDMLEKIGNADMKEFMAYLTTTKKKTKEIMALINSSQGGDGGVRVAPKISWYPQHHRSDGSQQRGGPYLNIGSF